MRRILRYLLRNGLYAIIPISRFFIGPKWTGIPRRIFQEVMACLPLRAEFDPD